MNTVEEKLQQAARNHAKTEELNDFKSDVSGFIAGAKAPESLEYWKEKEKLYNETEIRNLIMLWDSEGGVDWREVDKYFEQNKKK